MQRKVGGNMDNVGKRIKYYREQQGLSKEKVADYCGIKERTLSLAESNRIQLDYKLLVKLSQILKVKVEDLDADCVDEWKNAYGYKDATAGRAIAHTAKAENFAVQAKKFDERLAVAKSFMKAFTILANLLDFEICTRATLRDKKTGKKYS